jgi:quercetin dioxygenase-like cupin family protein
MEASRIPFQVIDWSQIETHIHKGENAHSASKTLQYSGLRVRLIQYEPGYLADHWCSKGHIVYCLDGEFISEMNNGDRYTLTAGMTYIVSDEMSLHRSTTSTGVKLLIIDGDFLK